MNPEVVKHYFHFFIVVLLCGGGCMYMPYMPAKQSDLKVVGLDEHTRARLLGQANPRPTDPEPEGQFGGRLGVVPWGADWEGVYGFTADVSPSEDAYERLSKLDGIARVYNAGLDLSDFHEARRRGEEPAPIDLKKRLLDDAHKHQTDLLLIYTTGHDAKAFDLTLGIGQIFLLGYCPTVVFTAEASTTAILMDGKTGYIYATTQGQGDSGAIGIGWSQAKKKAEVASDAAEESFDEVIDRLEEAWPMLQSVYP